MTVIELKDIRKDMFHCETVVALGNFDGVHTAHAELLKRTCELAKEIGAIPIAFTFSQKDDGVIPGKGVRAVMPESEKLELIKGIGIEYVCLAEFDELRTLSPREFTEDILKDKFSAKLAVCGFNYRFGKDGAGDHILLKELMGGNAFVMPPVMLGDKPVSSSRIRLAIEEGDLLLAAKMLGRNYYVRFPVMHGKKLGRTIGVPTINQNFPKGAVIPSIGVYACTAEVSGKVYPALTNVGKRPTVDNAGLINAETHIIGFDGWLYGEEIKVSFYKKLRDEIKFNSLEDLKARIAEDIKDANTYFKEIGITE